MPGPLIEASVIARIKQKLSNMEFDSPVFDGNGVQTGTTKVHANGPMVDQMSKAVGEAFFEILKDIDIVGVASNGATIKGVVE